MLNPQFEKEEIKDPVSGATLWAIALTGGIRKFCTGYEERKAVVVVQKETMSTLDLTAALKQSSDFLVAARFPGRKPAGSMVAVRSGPISNSVRPIWPSNLAPRFGPELPPPLPCLQIRSPDLAPKFGPDLAPHVATPTMSPNPLPRFGPKTWPPNLAPDLPPLYPVSKFGSAWPKSHAPNHTVTHNQP